MAALLEGGYEPVLVVGCDAAKDRVALCRLPQFWALEAIDLSTGQGTLVDADTGLTCQGRHSPGMVA